MSAISGYIEDAKRKLDKLDAHLNDLENKAEKVSAKADDWYTKQMEDLRRDWHDARKKVKKMVDEEHSTMEGHLEQTKAEFQKHWDALETAVDSYRNQVDLAEKTTRA